MDFDYEPEELKALKHSTDATSQDYPVQSEDDITNFSVVPLNVIVASLTLDSVHSSENVIRHSHVEPNVIEIKGARYVHNQRKQRTYYLSNEDPTELDSLMAILEPQAMARMPSSQM